MDEEMIARMRGAMLETGIVIGASSWPDEQEVAADRLARAAHSVIAAKVAELEGALKTILALDGPYCENCHSEDIASVFRIARAALAQHKGTDR